MSRAISRRWIGLSYNISCLVTFKVHSRRGLETSIINNFIHISLVSLWDIHKPLKADLQWPARETPFKWSFGGRPMTAQKLCWLVSFVIFQGIRTSIAKEPYSFVIFQGGGGGGGGRVGCPDILFPSLDPRMRYDPLFNHHLASIFTSFYKSCIVKTGFETLIRSDKVLRFDNT